MIESDLIEYRPFITEKAYLIGEKNGIPRDIVYNRFARLLWDIEKAITDPVKECKRTEWPEWKDVCKENGVSDALFYKRCKKMTPKQAATLKVGKRGGHNKKIIE